VNSLPLSRWIAPLALLALTIAFFWKLVLTDQYTWLAGTDISRQVLPWFQFQAGEWQQGRFPLWDPYHWAGQPLAGQAQPGALYPLNWLLFLSPTRNGWLRHDALIWYFVLIHYMAALFCYLLCRDLGRSRAASVLAGCVFAFGGYVGNVDWPQMLNGAVWAPLVFLFLLRILRGWQVLASAVLCGFFLGVSFLSGHHQVPLFVFYATLLTMLFFAVRAAYRRESFAKLALATVTIVVMAFLAGAAQILPAWEYSKLAYRWVGLDHPLGATDKVPFSILSHYEFGSSTVIGMAIPGLRRNAGAYVGITAFGLAVLALGLAWSHQAVRVMFGIGLGGLLYALGSEFPGAGLAYALFPALDKARSVSMAVILTSTAIPVLLAYSIDEILVRTDSKYISFYKIGCVVVAILIFTSVYFLFLQTGGDFKSDTRGAAVALTALLSALAIHAWQARKIGASALIAALGAILITDVSHGDVSLMPSIREAAASKSSLYELAAHGDVAQWLYGQDPPFRVTVDDQIIPYNFGDWFGLESMYGYLASLSRELFDMGPWPDHVRRLFGVRYHIGTEPSGGWTEEAYSAPSGLKVYRRPDVLPIARIVHQAEKIPEELSLESFIGRKDNDIDNVVYLPEPPPDLEPCEGGEGVRVVYRASNRVVVRAHLSCRGMLVLADTWYPGWKATVDGNETHIYKAYGVFRGVVLEPGPHTVEFRYRPWTVFLGAALSLLAVAFAFAAWLIPSKFTSSPQQIH
jgi:hypothetical protein